MSALPQIEPAEATGEAAALLTQVQKSVGAVPNLAKAMANSPALLQGWMSLSGALDGGVLPAAVRERLALAAAEYNRCSYCLRNGPCGSLHKILTSAVNRMSHV